MPVFGVKTLIEVITLHLLYVLQLDPILGTLTGVSGPAVTGAPQIWPHSPLILA